MVIFSRWLVPGSPAGDILIENIGFTQRLQVLSKYDASSFELHHKCHVVCEKEMMRVTGVRHAHRCRILESLDHRNWLQQKSVIKKLLFGAKLYLQVSPKCIMRSRFFKSTLEHKTSKLVNTQKDFLVVRTPREAQPINSVQVKIKLTPHNTVGPTNELQAQNIRKDSGS